MARRPFGPLTARGVRAGVTVWVLGASLVCSQGDAQTGSLALEHVAWPLLDIVMVPESAGVWLVVGPNPATVQWASGSHLVDLGLDPIVALQWVTLARKLPSSQPDPSSQALGPVTPPLRGRRGREFVMLARNRRKKPSDERAFIFAVSDSGAKIRWKTDASLSQVDAFLNALESAVNSSRSNSGTLPGGLLTGEEPDVPVKVISQPQPAYPGILSLRGRIGRVWMTYVVGADGRTVNGSLQPILTDHPLFTEAAMKALLRSRFKPALQGGRPIPLRVFQAIVFRIR